MIYRSILHNQFELSNINLNESAKFSFFMNTLEVVGIYS